MSIDCISWRHAVADFILLNLNGMCRCVFLHFFWRFILVCASSYSIQICMGTAAYIEHNDTTLRYLGGHKLFVVHFNRESKSCGITKRCRELWSTLHRCSNAPGESVLKPLNLHESIELNTRRNVSYVLWLKGTAQIGSVFCCCLLPALIAFEPNRC